MIFQSYTFIWQCVCAEPDPSWVSSVKIEVNRWSFLSKLILNKSFDWTDSHDSSHLKGPWEPAPRSRFQDLRFLSLSAIFAFECKLKLSFELSFSVVWCIRMNKSIKISILSLLSDNEGCAGSQMSHSGRFIRCITTSENIDITRKARCDFIFFRCEWKRIERKSIGSQCDPWMGCQYFCAAHHAGQGQSLFTLNDEMANAK